MIVIVGANLAGGRAAEALRAEGYAGRIVLIGEEPDRPYERPPLSKEYVRGESEPLWLRDETFYDDNQIELRLGTRATELDGNRVRLDDGTTIAFDTCLLCTGGRPRTLPFDGIHYLRTLRDADAIRGRLEGGPRVVVIGAGFIGAEIAASARTLGCDVTMLEVLPVPLGRVLGRDIGRVYAQIHRDHGVDLRLEEGIDLFDGSMVTTTKGNRIEADLVVAGVGIVPNVELAEQAGLETDNGVVVDELCRTSHPQVFAAGDVANRPDPWSGRRIRPEHFQNAQNQGRAAAKSMLGKGEPFREVPWFWSDQYDVNLQVLGHPEGDPVIRGDLQARDAIAFSLRGEHVVAAVALNRGRDVSVARRLIERGVKVTRNQLADGDIDLRDVLKS